MERRLEAAGRGRIKLPQHQPEQLCRKLQQHPVPILFIFFVVGALLIRLSPCPLSGAKQVPQRLCFGPRAAALAWRCAWRWAVATGAGGAQTRRLGSHAPCSSTHHHIRSTRAPVASLLPPFQSAAAPRHRARGWELRRTAAVAAWVYRPGRMSSSLRRHRSRPLTPLRRLRPPSPPCRRRHACRVLRPIRVRPHLFDRRRARRVASEEHGAHPPTTTPWHRRAPKRRQSRDVGPMSRFAPPPGFRVCSPLHLTPPPLPPSAPALG